MSKLLLLISLIGFISIQVFADGEADIKAACKRNYGYSTNPNSMYQKCVSKYAVLSGTRVCHSSNPTCKACLDKYPGDANKVMQCVQNAEQKQREEERRRREANRPKPKPTTNPTPTPAPKEDPVNDAGTLDPVVIKEQCRIEENRVYDPLMHGCLCAGGYEEHNGKCVSKVTEPVPQVAECMRELQEKVSGCQSTASTAVDKCDPKREEGSDKSDKSIDTLQKILKGATLAVQAGGAADNCAKAAVAGSTGYHVLEELRSKCDDEIDSCKSSCSEAISYINENKDSVYQECRKKAWNEQPLAMTEEAFNAEWDKKNKNSFEQQVDEMKSSVADNDTQCQSGTAVTNRQKMSDFMGDMDSAFKTASQCECQLSAGGVNCANQVGPADCTANPSLPGCVRASINCLSASDKSSPKCVNFYQASNVKPLNSNVSGFAAGAIPVVGATNVGGKGDSKIDVGDLSGLGSEVARGGTSGATTTDNGSPFGSAAGGGGGMGSSGGLSGGGYGESNAAATEDESTGSKIRGLFNVAKGALGNLFDNKKNDSSKGNYGANGLARDANGNPLDPKKWRPRGMVRGIAGHDIEIAGKFEDIWKVMNKQYKVQDQKDSFIFGEKN